MLPVYNRFHLLKKFSWFNPACKEWVDSANHTYNNCILFTNVVKFCYCNHTMSTQVMYTYVTVLFGHMQSKNLSDI